jgi:hypothetical protein
MVPQWWDQFFHTRTKGIQRHNTSHDDTKNLPRQSSSINAFLLCGRLRIAYAALILFDRFILSYDFEFFYLSGVMPCKQHFKTDFPESRLSLLCTLVAAVPQIYIPYVYYAFFYFGILNAILLLLGITPKLQLLLLQINMLSFHLHSDLIWDGEDAMFKIWNFLFLFLPLHRVTVYDHFRGLFFFQARPDKTTTTTTKSIDASTVDTEDETWPMWPFRLWQIEICCIYIGAGYTKLASDIWTSGNALYRVRELVFPAPFVFSIVIHFYIRHSSNISVMSYRPDHTYKGLLWWTHHPILFV